MTAFVYMLASRKHGTIYIGHTSDLARRVYEHETGSVPGFTKKYDVTRLVYYEVFDEISLSQQRERSLKKWPRSWKVQLIERMNPGWDDLKVQLAT